MTHETAKFLEKAERAMDAASTLLEIDDVEGGMSRAYYAMFYVAQALLCERNLSFSKHSGIHSAFGRHFAKTGELDPKFHQWLLAAFNKRIVADYGVDVAFAKTEIEEAVAHAREFHAAARRYLQTVP